MPRAHRTDERIAPTRAWLATGLTLLMLLASLPAQAGAFSRAKEVVEERPVAAFIAIPAFIITAPFMIVTNLMSDDKGDD